MKRLTSLLLSVATLITFVFPLGGCSTLNTTLSMGQWLAMINDSFGMASYVTEEPYFSNITSDNPYFATVQTAADWEVVDPSESLNINETLTWKDALITLVNVGSFMDVSASDDEKIEYAIDCFDNSIRKYWMNRDIPTEKAVNLLNLVQNQWAKKEYDHIIEETVYKEGVVDFTSEENFVEDYNINGNTIAISNNGNIELKKGDVFVLPGNDTNPFTITNIVEEIIYDDEYIYIETSDEELTLEDIAEDIFIEETFIPSAENAIIYDANGQVISVGSNVQLQNQESTGDFEVSNFLSANNLSQNTLVNVASSGKVTHTFDVGDWEISLEYKLNGDLDFKFEVKTPNMLTPAYQKRHPSQSLNASFAAELSNLKVTNEVDYKWFKLRSASLRVDYEEKYSGSLEFSGKPVDRLYAPEFQNNGEFLKNWKNSVWKDTDGENAKGAKTIKIASVDLYTVGVARVCLDINFTISAEGTASISLTQRGTKGIEYKNGKLRVINTCDKDVDVDLKAKVEATGSIGPALYVVGLKKEIIGLAVQVGLGAAFAVNLNLADTENHLLEETGADEFSLEFTQLLQDSEIYSDAAQIAEIAKNQGATYEIETSGKVKLHCDVCIDGCIYFILRVTITDTSYIADLLGGKIKTSWEVFGEKNAKLINIHADNLQFQFGYLGKKVECTLEYKPFDVDESTEKDEDNFNDENNTIIEGDTIILNDLYMSLSIDNHYYIQITEIPSGYILSDLRCASDNEKVVTVTDDGVVTAIGEGSAVITVYTKDKKYSAGIAITVVDPIMTEFNTIDA